MYGRKEQQPEQVINVGVVTMRTKNPLEHRGCEISSHDKDFQLSVASSINCGLSVIMNLAF